MSPGEGSGMLPDLVASRLCTAVVSDILDDLGHRDHVLDPAIRPRVSGPVSYTHLTLPTIYSV